MSSVYRKQKGEVSYQIWDVLDEKSFFLDLPGQSNRFRNAPLGRFLSTMSILFFTYKGNNNWILEEFMQLQKAGSRNKHEKGPDFVKQ